MRFNIHKYTLFFTLFILPSDAFTQNHSDILYPRFDLYPNDFQDLSIEMKEFEEFDQFFTSLDSKGEPDLDSLHRLSNYLHAFLVRNTFWNYQQAMKQNIPLEMGNDFYMDPIFHKRSYEHNVEVCKRVLGEKRMQAIHKILKTGMTSEDSAKKNICFNTALSCVPNQDYMQKALLYMNNENITPRQFMRLIDLLSSLVYEPAIDLIKQLQQADDRAFSFTTKALMKYGIQPDRKKIRKIIMNDLQSPSIHAIDVLSIAPEEEDIDFLINLIDAAQTQHAKKKCLDSLNQNFDRLNGEQAHKLIEIVCKNLSSDSASLLHSAVNTLDAVKKRENASYAKELMLVILQSVDSHYRNRYSNNFRRLIERVGDMKYPESLPYLFLLLKQNVSEDSTQSLLAAIDQVTDQEAFKTFKNGIKEIDNLHEKKEMWLSWWQSNYIAIQKSIGITSKN